MAKRGGRIAVAVFPWGVLSLTWVLLFRGFFRNPGSFGAIHVLEILLLAAALMAKFAGRLKLLASTQAAGASLRNDVELGILLLSASYVLVSATGGTTSFLYPLVYAMITFLSAFSTSAAALSFVATAVLLETASSWFSSGTLPAAALWRSGFYLMFAVLVRAMVSGHIRWLRIEQKGRAESLKREYLDRARYLRLASASSAAQAGLSEAEKRETREVGSALSVKEAVAYSLRMLDFAFQPHTCALYVLSPDGLSMYAEEAVSQSDCLALRNVSPREGLMGSVISRGQPVCVNGMKGASGTAAYYTQPVKVRCFAGVPLKEGDEVRGALIVDRRTFVEFTGEDMELLETASNEISRVIETERVLRDLDRERAEKEKFYLASQKLSRALTFEQVVKTAIESTRRFIPCDFLAVTTYDEEADRHAIAGIAGCKAEENAGAEFPSNGSLVSTAVKARHPIPYGAREEEDRRSPLLFCESIRVRGLRSLQVFPLVVKDRAIGTFTVGSEEQRRFTDDEWKMIGVISNQLAVELENARMYGAMERLATTDGLTGLSNHRSFQESLGASLARAVRFGKQVTLIMCDVDHFKKINDTHGHPVGDQVLKRVAEILRQQARAVDVVARYGGEEFAIVMEEVPAKGGVTLAERIRKLVKAQVFTSEIGKFTGSSMAESQRRTNRGSESPQTALSEAKSQFGVTASFGIASFPEDAKDKQQLIDRADAALYAAKESGRDKVCFHSMEPRRVKHAAGAVM